MDWSNKFRNPHLVEGVVREIRKRTTQHWTLMEICGGQTHSILQYGLDQLLPAEIELVHGPGCPVCVTPLNLIDKAIRIASLRDVILTTYGDMLRVPGSERDLFSVRAQGGQVRIVLSPLEAVKMAADHPDKQVVFFAIGFETTAPANATSVIQAKNLGLENYSILSSHVCVPPAMEAILSSPDNRVQGFLAAGHVCAVMGYWQYPDISEKYQVPIVVTGFEPIDILNGVLLTITQLESGQHTVENAYSRAVTYQGNTTAQEMIREVFQPVDREWRGIGIIPQSGLGLRPEYSEFDAETRYSLSDIQTHESSLCIAGEILRGLKKPFNCPAFGQACTPENPLGAPMVSNEGACSAYFRYRKEE